jgi:hypothetical protein
MSIVKGGPEIYKKLLNEVCREAFGEDIEIQYIDQCIKIIYPDGVGVFVSYTVREPITKTGMDIRGFNDITVALTDGAGHEFRPHISTHIYAVLNLEKNSFCRWYVINRKRTIELYRSGELHGYEKKNDEEGRFVVLYVDELLKRRLVERYKHVLIQQTLEAKQKA